MVEIIYLIRFYQRLPSRSRRFNMICEWMGRCLHHVGTFHSGLSSKSKQCDDNFINRHKCRCALYDIFIMCVVCKTQFISITTTQNVLSAAHSRQVRAQNTQMWMQDGTQGTQTKRKRWAIARFHVTYKSMQRRSTHTRNNVSTLQLNKQCVCVYVENERDTQADVSQN